MKRYTETNKWDDKWFRERTPLGKLMLGYLYDRCDDCGAIDIDYQMWAFQTKMDEDKVKKGVENLKDALLFSKDNDKIFIKDFLHQQSKLPLNPIKQTHAYIIAKLKRNLIKFNTAIEIQAILDTIVIPVESKKTKGHPKKQGEGEDNIKFIEPTYDQFKTEYIKQKIDATEEFDIKPLYNHYVNVGWTIGKTKIKMKRLDLAIANAITNNKKYNNNNGSKKSWGNKPKLEERDSFFG